MKRGGSKKQRKRGKPEAGAKLSGALDEDDLDEEELDDFYDDFPWMESVLKVLPGRAVSRGCLSTTMDHTTTVWATAGSTCSASPSHAVPTEHRPQLY